jgi:hypothetical protein
MSMSSSQLTNPLFKTGKKTAAVKAMMKTGISQSTTLEVGAKSLRSMEP